jgi:hypothetical protein
MRVRTVLLCVLAVGASFAGASYGLRQWHLARPPNRPPVVAPTPSLQPMTRASLIVIPTVVPLSVLHDGMEAQAPHDFAGKREQPISKDLGDAEITWTAVRGPLAVSGGGGGLAVSSALNGTLRATGKLSSRTADDIGSALGGLLGRNFGREVHKFAQRSFDQHADVRGNVTVTSRPTLTSDWRLDPGLTAQVNIADGGIGVAGLKLSVNNEVKPYLDRSVADQVNALQARLRTDPFIERAARREWAKLCRSIPLGQAAAGLPKLWLEIRPTRAFAAQPSIDAAAVTLTAGVQAQTRIVPQATTPQCPFPAKLEIVPPPEQGRINVSMPIDVPFSEVNRLIEARFAGKTFPPDGRGSFALKVDHASVAASGSRLLIALQVNVTARQNWFGSGGDATVYVWGRPVLDVEHQVLRLADTSLDVQSEGILGTAARTAMPYVEAALADHAVVDLKPFLAKARANIDTALADFRGAADGVRVDAAVGDLRLADLAFDAQNIRVVVEVTGAAKATLTSLPARRD